MPKVATDKFKTALAEGGELALTINVNGKTGIFEVKLPDVLKTDAGTFMADGNLETLRRRIRELIKSCEAAKRTVRDVYLYKVHGSGVPKLDHEAGHYHSLNNSGNWLAIQAKRAIETEIEVEGKPLYSYTEWRFDNVHDRDPWEIPRRMENGLYLPRDGTTIRPLLIECSKPAQELFKRIDAGLNRLAEMMGELRDPSRILEFAASLPFALPVAITTEEEEE